MPEERSTSVTQLREAIISVIAFFDLFDYPLTAYEILERVKPVAELEKIWEILDQETEVTLGDYGRDNVVSPLIIQQKNGFYFLSGHEELVTIRQKRYNYSYRKIKIAKQFTCLFSLCPFVRVVTLANSIGSYNLRDGSDIDFFIITSPRRIWLSRLYCTGLAKILNSRPNAKTKKDKICLSFYLSQEHLRHGLVLLYNKDKVYEKFLQINRGLDNLVLIYPAVKKSPGDYWEKQAKKIQFKIMPPILKAAMNKSDGVVINDQVLKLYQRDRRREYAARSWNRRSRARRA